MCYLAICPFILITSYKVPVTLPRSLPFLHHPQSLLYTRYSLLLLLLLQRIHSFNTPAHTPIIPIKMRFSTIIAVALSAVAASAHSYHNGTTNGTAEVTVTEVVTKYTTYCPLPTTIVENNQTYTVTEVCELLLENTGEYWLTSPSSGHHLDHQQLPLHSHQDLHHRHLSYLPQRLVS